MSEGGAFIRGTARRYDPRVEFSADLLAQPRARDAFLLRVVMGAPWIVHVEDEAPLSVVPVLRGRAWLAVSDSNPVRIAPGDVLVVRSPTAYSLSSDPALPHGARISSGQACSGPDGRDLSNAVGSGVRTWGNDPAGGHELLVGTYRSTTELGHLMLETLPAWFVVSRPSPEIVHLLTVETGRDRAGQGSVLDRLLDVLTVATLRAWAESQDGTHPCSAARRDDVVRHVLRAVQQDPARTWTPGLLAEIGGVSPSALTRRFHAAVGTSPMSYVARWRLAMGADLLSSTDATIATIARRTGYANPFSFSAAFKRRHGVSPREFRDSLAGR